MAVRATSRDMRNPHHLGGARRRGSREPNARRRQRRSRDPRPPVSTRKRHVPRAPALAQSTWRSFLTGTQSLGFPTCGWQTGSPAQLLGQAPRLVWRSGFSEQEKWLLLPDTVWLNDRPQRDRWERSRPGFPAAASHHSPVCLRLLTPCLCVSLFLQPPPLFLLLCPFSLSHLLPFSFIF